MTWLESWYNADGGELPRFVPYHRWFGPRTRSFERVVEAAFDAHDALACGDGMRPSAVGWRSRTVRSRMALAVGCAAAGIAVPIRFSIACVVADNSSLRRRNVWASVTCSGCGDRRKAVMISIDRVSKSWDQGRTYAVRELSLEVSQRRSARSARWLGLGQDPRR